ncbi:MAG: hypothetical protein QNJ45_01610 [Ardenticatenaceae bacterium]|nr:hypothetical protein [Ardenticatenaceae bacterium]
MLEDLMKAVLEGAQNQKQRPAAGGDLLTDILQGVLQGGGRPSSSQKGPDQPEMFNMADLIMGVLGGGTAQQSAGNPLADMAAEMLSQKLGISKEVAVTIVSFAMAALLNRQEQAGGNTGFDLDDLLQGDYAWDSGLANQISQRTGMSEDEAAYGLQEAMMMLSGQMAQPTKKSPRPKAAGGRKSGLDHLLDTWQVNG